MPPPKPDRYAFAVGPLENFLTSWPKRVRSASTSHRAQVIRRFMEDWDVPKRGELDDAIAVVAARRCVRFDPSKGTLRPLLVLLMHEKPKQVSALAIAIEKLESVPVPGTAAALEKAGGVNGVAWRNWQGRKTEAIRVGNAAAKSKQRKRID